MMEKVGEHFLFVIGIWLSAFWINTAVERNLEMEWNREMCSALSRQTAAKSRYGSETRIARGGYDWRQSALITSLRPPYSVNDYHQRTSEICVCLPRGLSHLGRNLSFLSLLTDLEWLCGYMEGLKMAWITHSHPVFFFSTTCRDVGLPEEDGPTAICTLTFRSLTFNLQKFWKDWPVSSFLYMMVDTTVYLEKIPNLCSCLVGSAITTANITAWLYYYTSIKLEDVNKTDLKESQYRCNRGQGSQTSKTLDPLFSRMQPMTSLWV